MNNFDIRVNGNEVECSAGMGLLQLFAQLEMNPKLVRVRHGETHFGVSIMAGRGCIK